MVKLKGPSIATEAHGSIADVVTFSKAKKRSYLKKHAKPANPKTPAQVSVRAMITFLSQNWKTLTPIQQATWNTPAFLEHIAPYHAYLKINMQRWRTFRGPGKTYPVPETSPPPGTVYQDLWGGVASIKLGAYPGGGTPPWGYITFRQPIDFNPPKLEQVIKVFLRVGVSYTFFLDTPLAPGTYWYRTAHFSENGQIRTFGGSKSATAT